MARQLMAQDNADHAPTAPMRAAFTAACRDLDAVKNQWNQVTGPALAAFNAVLAGHSLAPVASDATAIASCRPLPAGAVPVRRGTPAPRD